MEHFILYTCLILLLTIAPFFRSQAYSRVNRIDGNTENARLYYYSENISRNVILGIIILLFFWFYHIPSTYLGFRPLNLSFLSQQFLSIKLIIFFLILWYAITMYYAPIIGVRFDPSIRKKVIPVLKNMYYLAPQTKREKMVWAIYSLMGAVEELIYRGFIFFAASFIFGIDNIWLLILISVIFDAIQHLPRFKILPWVMYTALFYALLYAIFDSILVVMIIKIFHYMKIYMMPFHYVNKNQNLSGYVHENEQQLD